MLERILSGSTSMEYLVNKIDFQYKDTAVALGKFEGLHLGHQRLFHELTQWKKDGLKSVVFTFDMPPKLLIDGIQENVIYTKKEREFLLEQFGMDVMIVYPFKELRMLSPEAFVSEILVKRLDVKAIVVGEDFGFGYKRAGNIQLLQELSKVYGYQLTVVHKLQYQGEDISSSRIRRALMDGNLELANKMLGHPYTMVGEVVHGRQLGRTIGIPTANIFPDKRKYLPENGVYVARIHIEGEERVYYGICNIGVKPTIDQNLQRGVETFLFDFQYDIYGKNIFVELLHFVRPEMKFASVEQLSAQIHNDAEFGRNYVKKFSFTIK